MKEIAWEAEAEAKAEAEDQTKSQPSNFANSQELSTTEHQSSPLSPGTNIENSNSFNIYISDNNNDDGNDDPDDDTYDCEDNQDRNPDYIELDEPVWEDTPN
ncbi:uncharacterized protein FIESC28_11332 [Fusarium coffeatum]|uniref:Uncharacterized protein n=1 Tax=Fusarium coffeatum TaxID=231269 RepID=A0A366QKR4_9HYPO|nr:uncharacterized protein FIESC28_11332 [Fusarium coffeatum]RBR05521.1 hypothetical protein FIESC28_11332 [Fusarium coffeatum]